MQNALLIGLSRQVVLERQMDVVANNLANVNTTGFKGTDTLFAQYVFRGNSDDRTFKDKIAFTHDFGLVRNLSQGQFNFTNNTFDLALQGRVPGNGVWDLQVRVPPAEERRRPDKARLEINGIGILDQPRPGQ